jgi:hypothetical protein
VGEVFVLKFFKCGAKPNLDADKNNVNHKLGETKHPSTTTQISICKSLNFVFWALWKSRTSLERQVFCLFSFVCVLNWISYYLKTTTTRCVSCLSYTTRFKDKIKVDAGKIWVSKEIAKGRKVWLLSLLGILFSVDYGVFPLVSFSSGSCFSPCYNFFDLCCTFGERTMLNEQGCLLSSGQTFSLC